MESYAGELAALLTALFWTVTALAFEAAGKRVGSLSLNLIRLCLGFAFLTIYLALFKGRPLPLDANIHQWFWLSLSGVIGLTLGDFFLFKAFILIGSRVSMLIMATVPPLTALIGWLVMGETLTPMNLVGMTLVVGGITLVILQRSEDQKQVVLSRPLSGILIAFGGAIGQAVGLVLSKYGMGDYDAFAATQIRIIAGTAGFIVIITLFGLWRRVGSAVRDKKAMANMSLGAMFGPFLGVSFSLVAVKYTTAGVAATIMAIVPVLIIPPAVVFFKEKVTLREVIGAIVAVAGVAVLFLLK
ncbi:MAG: DMT family transporter [Candidatus Latescibacterota bacterium]|nr:MAG: DMT family transporter [Candidatus Latescibacterota bacterium]